MIFKHFELTIETHQDGRRCGPCQHHHPNPAEDGHTELCIPFQKDISWTTFGGTDANEFEMARLPECLAAGLHYEEARHRAAMQQYWRRIGLVITVVGAMAIGLIAFNIQQRNWITVCTLTASLVLGFLAGRYLRQQLDKVQP